MQLNNTELRLNKWKNAFQTLMLLVLMAAFVWLLGTWILGESFAFFASLFIVMLMLFNPALSTHFIMRAYSGSELREYQAPELFHALNILSQRAELRFTPKLFYIPVGTMNAFATGSQNNAAIGLSDGLLRQLNIEEIIGVLAHEISHIRHHDMRIMTISDLMGQLTRLLSMTGQLLIFFSIPAVLAGIAQIDLIPVLILIIAPSVSALVQLAISRRREFQADLSAAQLMGSPRPLTKALFKLDQQGSYWERFYRASSDNALLRTHPTTKERIEKLEALAAKEDWQPIQMARDHDPHWLPKHHIQPRKVSRYFWF